MRNSQKFLIGMLILSFGINIQTVSAGLIDDLNNATRKVNQAYGQTLQTCVGAATAT